MNVHPKAIVVDDSKSFLMYLSVLLNRMNLEVLPVTNAEEALELARVTKPHLMTLDLVMPGKDGLQILRELRDDEELRDLPVIMISSYQDKARHWEAMSLGCVDVLDKPLKLRRLHKALQSCNLYAGGRRRYLRAPYVETVELECDGQCVTLSSVTLSERGIYVRTDRRLRRGLSVNVHVPLPDGEVLEAGGKVIYCKSEDAAGSLSPPGVAIKFDRVTTRELEKLRKLVADLLIGDIIEEQQELFVEPPEKAP